MNAEEVAVVIFSGGQDSTTCLGWALNRYKEVRTITFAYGQRHEIELVQAMRIAHMLGVESEIFELDVFKKLGDSSLVGEGDISAPHTHKSELPSSYVPNRNALMFTIAHAYAQKIGAQNLITGVCESDYSGYPDCREVFVTSLEKSLNLGSESDIKFHYPLMQLTKAQTFKLALEEGVLEHVIKESHTCYEGNRELFHEWGYGCGECPACKLRAKGWSEFVSGLHSGETNA